MTDAQTHPTRNPHTNYRQNPYVGSYGHLYFEIQAGDNSHIGFQNDPYIGSYGQPNLDPQGIYDRNFGFQHYHQFGGYQQSYSEVQRQLNPYPGNWHRSYALSEGQQRANLQVNHTHAFGDKINNGAYQGSQSNSQEIPSIIVARSVPADIEDKTVAAPKANVKRNQSLKIVIDFERLRQAVKSRKTRRARRMEGQMAGDYDWLDDCILKRAPNDRTCPVAHASSMRVYREQIQHSMARARSLAQSCDDIYRFQDSSFRIA